MKYPSLVLFFMSSAMNAMELMPSDIRKEIAWQCIEESRDLPSMSRTICTLRATNKDFCHALYDLTGAADHNGNVDIKKNITFVQNYLHMRFPVIRSEIFAQKLPLKVYADYHRNLSKIIDAAYSNPIINAFEIFEKDISVIDVNYTWDIHYVTLLSGESRKKMVWSPLMYAITKKCEPMVDLLLEHGAHLEIMHCVHACWALPSDKAEALLLKLSAQDDDASLYMSEQNESLACYIKKMCGDICKTMQSRANDIAIAIEPLKYAQEEMITKLRMEDYHVLARWIDSFEYFRRCIKNPNSTANTKTRGHILHHIGEYLKHFNFTRLSKEESVQLYEEISKFDQKFCLEIFTDINENTLLHGIVSKINSDNFNNNFENIYNMFNSILSFKSIENSINVQNNKGYTPLLLLIKNLRSIKNQNMKLFVNGLICS